MKVLENAEKVDEYNKLRLISTVFDGYKKSLLTDYLFISILNHFKVSFHKTTLQICSLIESISVKLMTFSKFLNLSKREYRFISFQFSGVHLQLLEILLLKYTIPYRSRQINYSHKRWKMKISKAKENFFLVISAATSSSRRISAGIRYINNFPPICSHLF